MTEMEQEKRVSLNADVMLRRALDLKEKIQNLELDIQYLKSNLDNGWYIGSKKSKNDILASLEHKKNQLSKLIKHKGI